MASHDIDADTRDMGLTAIGAKREALTTELQDIRQKTKQFAQREQQILRDLRDCDAAERLFRKDPTAPSLFPIVAVGGGGAGTQFLLTDFALGGAGGAVATTPRIKDVVLQQLEVAGPVGTKAKFIRSYIEQTLNTAIHEKTVGMYLYRLLKDGKARREGVRWFFVPSKAE